MYSSTFFSIKFAFNQVEIWILPWVRIILETPFIYEDSLTYYFHKNYLQAMLDNYNIGRGWVDKNVPVYLDQVQPYITLTQEKSVEAWRKVKSVSTAGVVKLEELMPGAEKQINKFGENVVKYTWLLVDKTQILLLQARDSTLDAVK